MKSTVVENGRLLGISYDGSEELAEGRHEVVELNSLDGFDRPITTYEIVDGVVNVTYVEHVETDPVAIRANSYPPIVDQLDKLWHDINNNTLTKDGVFFTALKNVKDDNPIS